MGCRCRGMDEIVRRVLKRGFEFGIASRMRWVLGVVVRRLLGLLKCIESLGYRMKVGRNIPNKGCRSLGFHRIKIIKLCMQ